MNKQDIVNAVASNANLTKSSATQAVDTVLESITSSLSQGQEVRLTGFGTFSVTARKATTGRNPQTGATIQIPASKRPTFKAGKALKDSVNN
jgi:DNA-binding protein HU-beta